jgi:hypothetical protein
MTILYLRDNKWQEATLISSSHGETVIRFNGKLIAMMDSTADKVTKKI